MKFLYPIAVVSLVLAGQLLASEYNDPAHFRITDEIVQSGDGMLPLSCESGPKLNEISHEPYEPLVHRNCFIATGGSQNQIFADPEDLNDLDKIRDGYWDGAAVRVYRLVEGKLRLLRHAKVAAGGHMANGWINASFVPGQSPNKIITSSSRQAYLDWPSWWQPGLLHYVGVAAVDAAGHRSEVVWTTCLSPESSRKGNKVKNEIQKIRFRADKSDQATPLPVTDVHMKEREDGALMLTWQAGPDEDRVGFQVLYSLVHPDQQQPHQLRLEESGAPIQEYDVVVVEREATQLRMEHFSPRVAVLGKYRPSRTLGFVYSDELEHVTWQISPHDHYPDIELPTALEQARSMHALQVDMQYGASLELADYSHGSIKNIRETLTPGVPYVLEAWVRYEGGDSSARVTLALDGGIWSIPENANQELTITMAPNEEWHRISLEVVNAVPWTDDYGSYAKQELKLVGDGRFFVDEWRLYRKDVPFGGLLPGHLAQEAAAAKVSTFRQMWLNETGHRLTDIIAELHSYMQYAEEADADPYLALQHSLNEVEWRGLAAFFTQPYDPKAVVEGPEDPAYWARIRHRLGRDEPWLFAFERVFIQVNNQPYYRIFMPWSFPYSGGVESTTGEEYPRGYLAGAMSEYCFNVMRSSPAWNQDAERKVILAVQVPSRDIRTDNVQLEGFGYQTLRAAPSAGLISSALYNGGWDGAPNDFSVSNLNEGIFTMLQFNHSTNANWGKHFAKLQEHMKETGIWPEGALLGAYEIGPGYSLPAPGKQEYLKDLENGVGKSVAAATATLDNILTRALYSGVQFQNYFVLGRRHYFWSSHQELEAGGQAYPHWQLLALWNTEAWPGDMLRVDALSVPTLDVPNLKDRGAVQNAAQVAAYAIRKNDRLAVWVCSRKQDGTVDLDQDGNPEYEFGKAWSPVTIDLPIMHARQVTVYTMFDELRATNMDDANVRIRSYTDRPFNQRTVFDAAFTGADRDGIPPGCSALILYDGISM